MGQLRKPSSSRQWFNVTEKQKSVPKDALDKKGKRKRHREVRRQLPLEQDAQKACARPVGRTSANYDYNKNTRVREKGREIVILSSDEDDFDQMKKLRCRENVVILSSDDERGDFSLLGAPLSTIK